MSRKNIVPLQGCQTRPLASYLKSIGVLKIISEQGLDPTAQGRFSNGCFELSTTASYEEIRSFLIDDYKPVPAFSPWNSGAGFVGKAGRENIEAIQATEGRRFHELRDAITQIDAVMAMLGADKEFFKKSEKKADFFRGLRSRASGRFLEWLDVVAADTGSDGLSFSAILGSGGNDGRLEFSRKYWERIQKLFLEERPEYLQTTQLDHALRADSLKVELENESIGQFAPDAGGAPNGGVDFNSNALVNPWDYILIFEGALAFQVSIQRRSQHSRRVLAAPFSARSTGAGFASALTGEGGRNELWLPVWAQFANWSELEAIFAEGRVSIDGKPAVDGRDFAIAIASLGVDRGISSFERYAFLERNGRNHIAVPIGLFEVHEDPNMSLLADIDPWIRRWEGRCMAETSPGRVKRGLRDVMEAEIAYCKHGASRELLRLFIALGALQRALYISHQFSQDKTGGVPPLPLLGGRWLKVVKESIGASYLLELRLALSFVRSYWPQKTLGREGQYAPSTRQYVENVSRGSKSTYWLSREEKDHVNRAHTWTTGLLTASLGQYMERRRHDIGAITGSGVDAWRERSSSPVDLAEVHAYIRGNVDERLMEELIYALLLIDYGDVERHSVRSSDTELPPFIPESYGLIRLAMSPLSSDKSDDFVRFSPEIIALLQAGRVAEALKAARRRLFADGHPPAFHNEQGSRTLTNTDMEEARRILGALAFPLSSSSLQLLKRRFLATPTPDQELASSFQSSTPSN